MKAKVLFLIIFSVAVLAGVNSNAQVREKLSDQQSANRIVSHNKITDLTNGFELENGHSFTVLIITKANVTDSIVAAETNALLLVDVQLIQDDVSSVIPIKLGEWDVAAIKKISADAIDLSVYDVYWGSGFKSN